MSRIPFRCPICDHPGTKSRMACRIPRCVERRRVREEVQRSLRPVKGKMPLTRTQENT